MCISRPTLDAGSNYCGYEGTFYDANMNVTKAANSSSYAKHGAIFDVNCSGGYQEIYLIASAYNSSNGNKPNWGHYYYCNNGNWASVGRCLAKGNKTFSYTGGSQSFTPPINSNEQITLTLEVWGAGADGAPNCGNSKGGYSKGNYNISSSTLYIVVGGKGKKVTSHNNTNEGYNGGGKGSHPGSGDSNPSRFGYSGGGATHIATKNGVLSSLSSNKNSVLIVAGGGGGSHHSNSIDTCNNHNGTRGAGGGGNNNGIDGVYWINCSGWGGKVNGSETSGLGHSNANGCSSNSTVGSFGKGGDAYDNDLSNDNYASGGGGGGYYGGGGAGRTKAGMTESGGGGGSGYCGIDDCSGENGANGSDTEIDGVKTNGNGYAKISW